MPTYIKELINLSHTVCVADRSSPHTLVELLDRYRTEYARDLHNARQQWSKTPIITEYKRLIMLDLAEIEKAIARTKYKIALRGF